jgi:hypothetical protein
MRLSASSVVWLEFAVTVLVASCTATGEPLKAGDLLARVVKAGESLPSHTFTFETIQHIQPSAGDAGAEMGYKGVQHVDGERADVEWREYERIGDAEEPLFEKRLIWNGQQRQFRQRGLAPTSDQLVASISFSVPKRGEILRSIPGHFLYAQLPGDDVEVAAVMLRGAPESLTMRTDKIGSIEHVVVQTKNAHGFYQLWLDPTREYSVVRVRAGKRDGDLYYGRPLPAQLSEELTCTAVDFEVELQNERIDGRYVAVDGTLRKRARYTDGGEEISEIVTTRSHVQLNPDFHALGAFVMEGIPEGHTVGCDATPQLQYVWQDHEAVLESHDATAAAIDSAVSQEKLHPPTLGVAPGGSAGRRNYGFFGLAIALILGLVGLCVIAAKFSARRWLR